VQQKIYTFLTFQNILEQLIQLVCIFVLYKNLVTIYILYYIHIHNMKLRSFISWDFLLTRNDFGMSVKRNYAQQWKTTWINNQTENLNNIMPILNGRINKYTHSYGDSCKTKRRQSRQTRRCRRRGCNTCKMAVTKSSKIALMANAIQITENFITICHFFFLSTTILNEIHWAKL